MAPDTPRSGSASALTVTEPIHYHLLRKDVGLTVYKCSGTPADCVKLAFHTVLDRKPDLVVGGINHGDNSSVNVHYSGTMGVVIEGCLKGVPSIGFSLCSHEPNADFEPAGPYIREIARQVLEKGLPPLTCLNVNIPDTKELKGIKVCEQTKGQWINEWENFAHRGDAHYYWLTGEFENNDAENEKNDSIVQMRHATMLDITLLLLLGWQCVGFRTLSLLLLYIVFHLSGREVSAPGDIEIGRG